MIKGGGGREGLAKHKPNTKRASGSGPINPDFVGCAIVTGVDRGGVVGETNAPSLEGTGGVSWVLIFPTRRTDFPADSRPFHKTPSQPAIGESSKHTTNKPVYVGGGGGRRNIGVYVATLPHPPTYTGWWVEYLEVCRTAG